VDEWTSLNALGRNNEMKNVIMKMKRKEKERKNEARVLRKT
jgi:hypothetical protein